VEAVRFGDAKPALEKLRRDAAVQTGKKTVKAQPDTQGKTVVASLASTRKLPLIKARAEIKTKEVIRTASLSKRPGYVLDYNQINTSQTNYIFKGDATYYISGAVNLYGTTTMEGGAVIKYAPTNSASILVNSTVDFQGEAFRPTIFTSRDDNTMGEAISGSTGNPTTNRYSLGLHILNSTNTTVSYTRFSFATEGSSSITAP